MTYDLHLHSCLSPCADDDMTPANIAGFAKLNGIDLMAITDHNSALNLPAAQTACDYYGVRLLPGIEVNTREEIHLLLYCKDVETALVISAILYEQLPAFSYDRNIWGRQLVVDAHGTPQKEPQKLLTSAVALDIYEVCALAEEHGALVVPAHVDRETTSLLSVLGFAPPDLPFQAFEVQRPEHSLEKLQKTKRLPADDGIEILTSSDAHRLLDIPEHPRRLAKDSVIHTLL